MINEPTLGWFGLWAVELCLFFMMNREPRQLFLIAANDPSGKCAFEINLSKGALDLPV
jgi:hypothetical protein